MLKTLILLSCIAFCFADQITGHLLVVNTKNDSVAWINLRQRRIEHVFRVGRSPHQVCISKDYKLGATADRHSNSITVMDLQRMKIMKTIHIPQCKTPHGIEFMDNEHVWVSCEDSEVMMCFNVMDGRLTQTIKMAHRSPHSFVINKRNTNAMVTDKHEGEVMLLDLSNRKTIKSLNSGKGAGGIVLNFDETELWVANSRDNNMSIIDVKDMSIKSKPKTGDRPHGLCATRFNTIAVTNEHSGDMWLFDASKKMKKKEIKFGMYCVSRAY